MKTFTEIRNLQEAPLKIDRGRQAIGLLDKQRAAKVRAIAKKYKLKTDEHPSTKYRPPKDAAKLKGLVDITLIGPPGIVDKAMKEVPMHPDVAKLLKQQNESVINEGKLSDEMIRRNFPNVWAMSAKEPKILDMFHKAVDTSNFKKKVQAYRKMLIGPFIRDELGGGYLDPMIIKKLKLKGQQSSNYKDLYYEKSMKALRSRLNDLSEANFQFVDMDNKTRDAVLKLAKKYGLKSTQRKGKGGTDVDVSGPNNKLGKFMENLPQDALEGVQKEFTSISMKDIMRKHGTELKKVVRTGNLELSDRAEEDLVNWAYDNGEVMTDDPDEFIEWLDNNIDDIVKGRIR